MMSDGETMDDSLWSHLPPEIVADVLVRLPVKSLCRFKCVSPSWKTLISSPQFAKTHLHIAITTKKPPKALLRSSSDALYSVDLADANPTCEKLDTLPAECFGERLMASEPFNGLLLVHGISYEPNFLSNPFTRECKKLPKSPLSDINWNENEGYGKPVRGFGYDSCMDDYKVVMVHTALQVDDADTDDVAVYSMKTDAWSRIQVSHNWLEPQTGVYLNDRLHWLCWYNLMNAIAFDLSDQVFREIQLPDYELDSECLVVLRGCLCLVCFSVCDDGTEVWMMNKYGVTESWTKFRIADPMMYIDGVLYLSAKDEFVLRVLIKIIEEDGEIIVDESKEKQLVLYNPEKETVRVMIVPGIPTGFAILGNTVDTLLSPNHGGQIMRQCEASSRESS
ncbi:F-box/kelch-repeat protein At3g06240-like [Rhododendron vialii]|uniref:F-box/kelch-repeat protein At3g06240-like n=1 Tax=Rhododendron vialii TaxID=182163 RepID=UPI00265EF519|nr:F-box/kelch-repeat protein At3g06240-like [Rhododendron vialii]XP_058202316.1 F-box/kelch-repeat protein At3g06240-like [Rhododendron vialii]